jgi:hypothetical protein
MLWQGDKKKGGAINCEEIPTKSGLNHAVYYIDEM